MFPAQQPLVFPVRCVLSPCPHWGICFSCHRRSYVEWQEILPPPPVFSAVLCFPVSICRFLLLFPENVLLLHQRQTRFPFTSAPRRERMSVASQRSRPSASGAELRGRRVTFPAGGPPPPPPAPRRRAAQRAVPHALRHGLGGTAAPAAEAEGGAQCRLPCVGVGRGLPGPFSSESVCVRIRVLSPRAEMAVKTAVDERRPSPPNSSRWDGTRRRGRKCSRTLGEVARAGRGDRVSGTPQKGGGPSLRFLRAPGQ